MNPLSQILSPLHEDLRDRPHPALAYPITFFALISGLLLSLTLPLALTEINHWLFRTLVSLHLGMNVALALLSLHRFYLGCKALKGFGIVLLVVSTFLAATWVVLGLLPITARDALLYHLALPKWWIEHGAMFHIPWHEWSHFPSLIALGFTGLMQHGLESLTPLYHFTFLLISGGIIWEFTHSPVILSPAQPANSYSTERASIAFALWVTIPIVMRVSSEPMVDLALATFFLAGAHFLIRALASLPLLDPSGQNSTPLATQLALWSGVGFGLACSIKYTAFLALAIFLPIGILLTTRSKIGLFKITALNAIAAGTALLISAPWLIRNFIWTKNPFHPFLGTLFGNTEQTVAFTGDVSPLLYRLEVYGETPLQVALLPLRAFFGGLDHDPSHFDGRISALLLLGFAPLIIKELRTWPLRWLTWFIALFSLTSIFLSYFLIRYHLPSIALLSILSAYTLFWLLKRSPPHRYIAVGLILLHLSFSAFYSVKYLLNPECLAYLSRIFHNHEPDESRQRYLRASLSDYSAIEWINKNLTKGDRIYLVMTGNRFYYLNIDSQSQYFSAHRLLTWISNSSNAESLAQTIKKEGFTHLLIQLPRTTRVLNDLDPTKKAIWKEFAATHLTQLYRERGYGVYRIK